MVFINNTASYGGSSLYGGGLDQCSTYDQVLINALNTEENPSALAGEPYDVCLCEHNKLQPNCSVYNKTLQPMPFQDRTSPFVLLLLVIRKKEGPLESSQEPFVLTS